jgi:hypothetical protein
VQATRATIELVLRADNEGPTAQHAAQAPNTYCELQAGLQGDEATQAATTEVEPTDIACGLGQSTQRPHEQDRNPSGHTPTQLTPGGTEAGDSDRQRKYEKLAEQLEDVEATKRFYRAKQESILRNVARAPFSETSLNPYPNGVQPSADTNSTSGDHTQGDTQSILGKRKLGAAPGIYRRRTPVRLCDLTAKVRAYAAREEASARAKELERDNISENNARLLRGYQLSRATQNTYNRSKRARTTASGEDGDN